jgi:hypothetical protein
MDFKLVSKNNMGVVATLILVILLSQSKFFNFLIDNALGRMFLIFCIVVISFVNKILGVVTVLFIIIMFNQSSMFNQSIMGFYEGFTTPTQEPSTNDQNSLDKLKQKELQSKQNASSASTTTTKNNPSTGIEGFNTVDREGVILRGKRSSEMPLLSNVRNQSDNIEPTDTSIFTNTYSSF